MNVFFYKQLLLTVFWLCLGSSLFAQTPIIVESVQFSNIKKLNKGFLEQLMVTQPGDTLNMATLNEDESQLRRLAAVAITKRQILPLEKDPNRVNIIFEITERRTLLPIIGIGGIEDNFWFLLGASEYNLGGKNKTLSAQFLLNDGLPNFEIFYKTRRIRGSKWGFSAEAKRSASIEPLFFPEGAVDFRYSNIGVGINAIHSFNPNRHLSGGFQFFREDYLKLGPEPLSELPGPNTLTTLKWLTNLRYKANNLKYDYYLLSGNQLEASLQWVITFGVERQFLALILEGSKFWRPYKSANFAARIKFGISNNDPSPFVAFVVDSQFNLRGVGNRVDRGTAQAVVNLEYRQTIFTKNAWASQLVAFSDMGTWRNPGGSLSDLANKEQFRQFVGVGIRVINIKYFLATFRLDFGFDIFDGKQKGFVLGMGQYF